MQVHLAFEIEGRKEMGTGKLRFDLAGLLIRRSCLEPDLILCNKILHLSWTACEESRMQGIPLRFLFFLLLVEKIFFFVINIPQMFS